MSDTIDKQYYEIARPGSIAEMLLKKARNRIYKDFLRLTAPTDASTILDVGVSDVHTDGANWIEVNYPHKHNISACGLGDAFGFREAFPEVSYTKIEPNKKLPYDDDEFDIVTSNAVLEHVGSIENQRRFLSELTRVAKVVFVSVPHRYFPVEHHTGIPFFHYTDLTFSFSCKLLGKEKWLDHKNLILMTRSVLAQLSPQEGAVGYTGLSLGPFSSNLFLYYHKHSIGGM